MYASVCMSVCIYVYIHTYRDYEYGAQDTGRGGPTQDSEELYISVYICKNIYVSMYMYVYKCIYIYIASYVNYVS